MADEHVGFGSGLDVFAVCKADHGRCRLAGVGKPSGKDC
jgi:hypothetical protein